MTNEYIPNGAETNHIHGDVNWLHVILGAGAGAAIMYFLKDRGDVYVETGPGDIYDD